MGFLSETLGNGNSNPTPKAKQGPKKKSAPADADAPIKLKSNTAELGDFSVNDATAQLAEDLARIPDVRRRLEKLFKEEPLVTSQWFRRVFVKKDAPEGDSFKDEDKALDEWGADGYTQVFRLVEDGGLGRVATTEETVELIRLAAERKRKLRKSSEN